MLSLSLSLILVLSISPAFFRSLRIAPFRVSNFSVKLFSSRERPRTGDLRSRERRKEKERERVEFVDNRFGKHAFRDRGYLSLWIRQREGFTEIELSVGENQAVARASTK